MCARPVVPQVGSMPPTRRSLLGAPGVAPRGPLMCRRRHGESPVGHALELGGLSLRSLSVAFRRCGRRCPLIFEQAGFKAPKPEDVDLLSLLQRNRDDLPQEILDALPAAPTPNPVQEGKVAGVEWRNSVGKLRDLGQRKLKLQEDIDSAKANLKALLTTCSSPFWRHRLRSTKPLRSMKPRFSRSALKRPIMGLSLSCRPWVSRRMPSLRPNSAVLLPSRRTPLMKQSAARLRNSTFHPAWLHSSALNLRLLRSPGLPRVPRAL